VSTFSSLNLDGNVYGSWTVLYRLPVKGKTRYRCLCSCGTTKSVDGLSLVSGQSTNCGCVRKIKLKQSRALPDLSGMVFDSWEVLEPVAPLIGGKASYRCRCKCGKISSVRAADLIKGKTKSCGCSKSSRTKESMTRAYGVDNPQKQSYRRLELRDRLLEPGVQEKMRRATSEKYGASCIFSSAFFRDLKVNSDWSTSKAEREILEFVRTLAPAHKHYVNKCEIDVFVPSKMVGFEYNGLYYHSELFKKPEAHKVKTDLVFGAGIRLYQIFEHEWHEKKDQVKSRIKSLLGLNSVRVAARKCDIREVDPELAKGLFLNVHIQGAPRNVLRYFGLFFEEKLVAAAAFSRHHRHLKQIVMSRFACLDDHTVQGGLSRISRHASKFFEQDIVSWCDLRWSSGAGYASAGWIEEKTLPPDYFYTNSKKAFSKQSRRKKLISTPAGMTEHEHAMADGLHRVYDCGKVRFIYRHLKQH